MRIYCESMAHPKRLSKRLSKAAGSPLNLAQRAVAVMFGYANWHELEQVTSAQSRPPSLPDRLCPPQVVESRRAFQLRALCETLEVKERLSAFVLLNDIKPTNSFRTRTERERRRALELIFPIPWAMVEPIEEADLRFRFSASLGAEEGIVGSGDGSESDDEDIAGNSRVLSISPLDSDAEGVIVAKIHLRMQPIIDEDIVVSLDVTVQRIEFGDEVDEEYLDGLVECIVSYLNSPCLNPWSKSDLSGAIEGVDVRVHGVAANPLDRTLFDQLFDRLHDESDRFNEGGHSFTDSDVTDEPRYRYNEILPARTVESHVRLSVSEEEVAEAIESIGAALCTPDGEVFLGFIQALPQIAEAYLQRKGASHFADLLGSQTTETEKGVIEFAARVRAVQKSGAMPPQASIAIRHLLSHAFIEGPFAPEAPADDDRFAHVNAAKRMKDPELEDYLASATAESIGQDTETGMRILLEEA